MGELYINGCSHSTGTELSLGENFQHKTWGAKLGKILGKPVYNDAEAASGNDKIVRKTFERISDFSNIPDLAIIQFTIEDRYDAIHPETLTSQSITPSTYTNEMYFNIFKETISKSYYDKILKKYTKAYRNINIRAQKEFLQRQMVAEMFSLQSFFENYNIPYAFIIFSDILPELKDYNVFKSINKSNVINSEGDTVYCLSDIFFSYGFELCEDKDERGVPDNHFKEDAQEFLAERIYNFLETGEKLLPKNRDFVNYGEIINHYG